MKSNSPQDKLLSALGLTRWQSRHSTLTHADRNAWAALKQEVTNCTLCDLCRSRSQTVFGVGDTQARLVIIGEAPGFHEDQQGEPFVGRAGLLLNAMLQSIGLERGSVYIANILKCRPPDNRDPSPEEVLKCTPYLRRQLALLNPTCLLAVGRVAAHFLLESTTPLSKMRGHQYSYGPNQIPLFVTYHPAYLLRNPADKGKAFVDLRRVREFLSQHSSE